LQFEASLSKKLVRPPISTKKPDMVESVYDPRYVGAMDRRIAVSTWPQAKMLDPT
jgi:hypothetical protein